MRLRIAAVGRVKEKETRALLDEYYKRIGRYARFDELELKDGREADVAERFARAIPERAQVVAMEVEGKSLGSTDFARRVERAQVQGVQDMVFLIGGSYGLPEATSRAADWRLSLGAMTLPHRLARLILAEQIYRAFTIIRNEPYSH